MILYYNYYYYYIILLEVKGPSGPRLLRMVIGGCVCFSEVVGGVPLLLEQDFELETPFVLTRLS